jgi:uncharacterized membrane protein
MHTCRSIGHVRYFSTSTLFNRSPSLFLAISFLSSFLFAAFFKEIHWPQRRTFTELDLFIAFSILKLDYKYSLDHYLLYRDYPLNGLIFFFLYFSFCFVLVFCFYFTYRLFCFANFKSNSPCLLYLITAIYVSNMLNFIEEKLSCNLEIAQNPTFFLIY